MLGLRRALAAHPQLSRVGIEVQDDPRLRDIAVRFQNGDERWIRFPQYPDSGHMVALHAPEALLSDVRVWLESEVMAGELKKSPTQQRIGHPRSAR